MARKLSKGRKKLVYVPKALAPTAAEARSLTILNGTGGPTGIFYASDYALVDGFSLGFAEPEKVDSTPIGSPRNTFAVGEGELNASVNFARDVESGDKAWVFHEAEDAEFWAVLREGVKLASEPWAVGDDVNVFDLATTPRNARQDAEIDSFNVVYGQGVGHERDVKVVAGS